MMNPLDDAPAAEAGVLAEAQAEAQDAEGGGAEADASMTATARPGIDGPDREEGTGAITNEDIKGSNN